MPAQDWCFVEDGPETYPEKSRGKWGGHLKQLVAISANAPFLLDELTPSGVKLFVALGWEDDEKSHGYAAAKDKVAKRVPAQDWCFVDPSSTDVCPEKSRGEHPYYKGPHNKQVVAISANGMKHLLAHVPNQDLANAWLQYLIGAEHKLRLFREATDRDELKDSHKKNYGAVIDRHGVKKGQGMIAIANNTVFDKSKQGMQALVKETKDLKGKPENINPWKKSTGKNCGRLTGPSHCAKRQSPPMPPCVFPPSGRRSREACLVFVSPGRGCRCP